LIAERSFAPWALPAQSHACCFADIFGTWDFAVWLTGNQLQTRDQIRIRDELGRRECCSLYRLDTLLPEAVQNRILGSGPNLVGRMSE
jgi:hypothetical protein